jgi:flagellar protein FlaJ
MPLNNYQKMCYKRLGRVAENAASDRLKEDLESAHIDMRAGAYLSCVWFNTILTSIVSTVIYLNLIIFLQLDISMIVLLLFIPILSTIGVYFYFLKSPAFKSKARAKKIDMHLPYALNFISAMSSAGITPTEIFRSLSKQEIYGEIREEALWIYRDVGLLGRDVITAIKDNINRSPSAKFKEFLQGAVVTVQSGGALKPYFMAKADQYMRENRLAQKQFIETLGILAESYVTAAVAGVLLIIIIVPLLMIITGLSVADLYGFAFVIIPVILMIHTAFAVLLTTTSERV